MINQIDVRAESQNIKKLASRFDGSTTFEVRGMPNLSKFDKEFVKNVGSFPDHSWDRFLMDFGTILAPSWEPKWSHNRYEKNMMTRMVKKSEGYRGIRNQGFEARGAGRRRAKPLFQYSTKDWM